MCGKKHSPLIDLLIKKKFSTLTWGREFTMASGDLLRVFMFVAGAKVFCHNGSQGFDPVWIFFGCEVVKMVSYCLKIHIGFFLSCLTRFFI